MYIPTAFAQPDTAKLHDFVRRHSFAMLISNGELGLVASHLPLLFEANEGTHGRLVGHMARANPHWKQSRGEVLAVFSGPHTYVSPSWYEEDGTVPTWNYLAVHAYGEFQIVEDREPLLEILRKSVQTYEGPREEPWVFDESADHVETFLKAIIGFRIEITRIEGKWKLSQNHSEERRRKVVRALESQSHEDARVIAQLISEGLKS